MVSHQNGNSSFKAPGDAVSGKSETEKDKVELGQHDSKGQYGNVAQRLRVLSELFSEGLITLNEKYALKELLIHDGRKLGKQLEEAIEAKDIPSIRRLLYPSPIPLVNQQMNCGSIGDFDAMLSELEECRDLGSFRSGSMGIASQAAQMRIPLSTDGTWSSDKSDRRSSQGIENEIMTLFGTNSSDDGKANGMAFDGIKSGLPESENGFVRKRQVSRSSFRCHKKEFQSQSRLRPSLHQSFGLLDEVGTNDVWSVSVNTQPEFVVNHANKMDFNELSTLSTVHVGNVEGMTNSTNARNGNKEGDAGESISWIKEEQEDEDSESLAEDNGEQSSGMVKMKKNERERKRRLAIARGFQQLRSALQDLEASNPEGGDQNMYTSSKLKKFSILKASIEKIQQLEHKIAEAQERNARLKSLLSSA